MDVELAARVTKLEKELKKSKHHDSGDDTLKSLIEMFRNKIFKYTITTDRGATKVTKITSVPFDNRIMEAAINIYNGDIAYFKALDKLGIRDVSQTIPDTLHALGSKVHTGNVNDLFVEVSEAYIAAEKSPKQFDPTDVADSVEFTPGIFNWAKENGTALGKEYENFNVCHACSAGIARSLRQAGLPSSVTTIAQLDISGVSDSKVGDHKVAITQINGVTYIVDQPQRELLKPLDKPEANVGIVTNETLTPRFIEFTRNNINKHYGTPKKHTSAAKKDAESKLDPPIFSEITSVVEAADVGRGIGKDIAAVAAKGIPPVVEDVVVFGSGLKGLSLNNIKERVASLIESAKNAPNKTFDASNTVNGLTAIRVEEIAPLFVNAIGIENINLPLRLRKEILKNKREEEIAAEVFESDSVVPAPSVIDVSADSVIGDLLIEATDAAKALDNAVNTDSNLSILGKRGSRRKRL